MCDLLGSKGLKVHENGRVEEMTMVCFKVVWHKNLSVNGLVAEYFADNTNEAVLLNRIGHCCKVYV